MNYWTNFLLNAEKIAAIFPGEVPSLVDVDLHEVVLHRDGPRITLRFDLANYPKVAPKKWEMQKFNRVQLQLTLIGIVDISIKGWATECKIDLLLQKVGNRVKLLGSNELVEIEVVADFVRLDEVSAYCDTLADGRGQIGS